MGPAHDVLCEFYGMQGQVLPIVEYVDLDPSGQCHSEKFSSWEQ